MLETMTTISEAIKSATSAAHSQTEKTLVTHIKAIRTKEEYAVLLSCLYSFYAPLEAPFNTWVAPVLPDYAQRRKPASILHDIAVLGLPAPEQVSNQLPVIQTPSAALGCFYVLEGSVMGGAIIKKMVQGKCPDIPDEAFSFFLGYEQHNGVMWRNFLAQFNEVVTTEQQKTVAIAAANDCFAQFERSIVDYYLKVGRQ